MNIATFIVLAIIVFMVIIALSYTKKHGVDSCGGNCAKCNGHCVANIKRGIEAARTHPAADK